MKLTAFIAAAILALPVIAAPAKIPIANEEISTSNTLRHKYRWAATEKISNKTGPTGATPVFQGKPVVVKGSRKSNTTRIINNKPRPKGYKSTEKNKPVNVKAIPMTQDLADDTPKGQDADESLGPIAIAVTPNGLLIPFSSAESSSMTGGVLEDPSLKPEQDAAPLVSRATLWNPAEINNYHEGVKIDIKISIVELKDKLDYLNKNGQLTAQQAKQQIDELANVVEKRVKLNFIKDTSVFDEMLAALREHIVTEMGNGQLDASNNPPLTEAQQADQDFLFANLHAYYIIEGLQEKLIRLAKNRKLDKRLGNINIMQTRQIIKTTPNLTQEDLNFYEAHLKRVENAMQAMTRKKLIDLPASAVSLIPLLETPMRSDFKLPGEEELFVEPSVEPSDEPSIESSVDPSDEPPFESSIEPSFGTSSEEFTSENQDLQNGISTIQGRSTPLAKLPPFADYTLEADRWGTVNNHHKRDTDVTENSPNTVTDTAPIVDTKSVPEDSFWVDFGASECLKIIFDENLDHAKLESFEKCEDKFEPEAEETKSTEKREETVEAEEVKIEDRDAGKHVYEIEMAEWGRGVIN